MAPFVALCAVASTPCGVEAGRHDARWQQRRQQRQWQQRRQQPARRRPSSMQQRLPGHADAAARPAALRALGRWRPPVLRGRGATPRCGAAAAQQARGEPSREQGEQAFEQQLAALAAWRDAHGSCHVPRTAADAAPLAAWVAWARRAGARGGLAPHQRAALDALGFVWRPPVLEAQWHATYHTLRLWLQRGGSLEALRAHAAQAAADRLAAPLQGAAAAGADGAEQAQQPGAAAAAPPPPGEAHEAALWLARQEALYGKLKLTAIKVAMLRRLGVRLRRQAGLAKPDLHPVLRGVDPDTYQRRPIVVAPATREGRRAVGRLLARHAALQAAGGGRRAAAGGAAAAPPSPGEAAARGDAACEFVVMLAELQRWKKRHGTALVPPSAFDRPRLAAWVAHLRALRAAELSERGQQQQQLLPPLEQQQSRELAEQSRGPEQQLLLQQQQQQQQEQQEQPQAGPVAELGPELALAALERWHVRELDAVGFVWRPSPDAAAWHARFHELRRFKQLHHHTRVPEAAGEWAGLAAWLAEQRRALAGASASSPRLSAAQARMLRVLGVAPAGAADDG
ncbi:hypothetical protein HT031_006216 [Scenedesmus sp. PABB004]|nr:hypothetical protein HT031_006216 [Scenedesmus sp. PABB004]